MIPERRLSTQVISADLILPDPQVNARESKHLGGVALNDPSQGLSVQTWYLRADGGFAYIRADSVAETLLFSVAGTITEASLAFDQNMRPFVAFVEDGVAKFRWFDSTLGAQTISTLPGGCSNPRCTLDDNRLTQTNTSDIILAYVRAGSLYFRAQRDRYEVEYFLRSGVAQLRSVAMNKRLRLQFHVASTPG